jgi:RNA recognition motif-containing protein
MSVAYTQDVVHPEPKVFVGQVPPQTSESQLRDLFGPHGSVRTVSLPRNPSTNEIRRFAMVTFEKWAAAERAISSLHGGTGLGGDKPLVVRFADPPRSTTGTVEAGKGVVPKKLFVGQVRLCSGSDFRMTELQHVPALGVRQQHNSHVGRVVPANRTTASTLFSAMFS